MSATARLSLPYIAPQQAQKQVTYNTAMAILDQLVQTAALSRTMTAPPVSPSEGDTYIVAAGATGDWATQEHRLASWQDGAWSFLAPSVGWLAYVVDATELAVYQPGGWTTFVTNGGDAVAKFGINAGADTTNRLAVASAASLFSHDGGDHRLHVDKAGSGDTASLMFETGFSGRAELGLAGDDDFHLKVSSDGSSWREALTVARADGTLGVSAGRLAFPAAQNASADPHTLDDYEEGVWTPTLSFGGGSTGIVYSAATKGRYTKVGRAVSLSAVLSITNKGSSTGAALIGGLPFAAASDGLYGVCALPYVTGLTGISGVATAMIPPGASLLTVYQSLAGATAALSNANFTNSASLWIGGTYDTV